MAKTIFSHEVRSLLCSNCGAPIEVALSGGQTTCAYCGAVHSVARRDESTDIQLAEAAPQMGESERFGHLRAQDASPRPMPAGLEAYLFGSELEPKRVQDALSLWQLTRQGVQRGAPFPDQDRLFFLTVLLARAMDDKTRRALLESAVELLPDVRHRQVLRCSLAEQAVLAGDLEAARQWLRPCTPRSTDLQMDTAFRIATAALAAAEGRPQDVLAQLGSQPGDIPLADDAEAKAELLRADAVERTWGPGPAKEQLTALMLREPRRLHAFEGAARELAPLGLCPQSAPAATAALWSRIDGALRPRKITSVGCLVTGALIPASGLVFVVLAGLGFISRDPAAIANLVAHPLILVVLIPTGVLIGAILKRKKAVALRDHGVLTIARVVSCTRRVETSKNSTTVYQDLELHVLMAERYVASSKSIEREEPIPLGVYPCLVDPQPPHRVALQIEPLQ